VGQEAVAEAAMASLRAASYSLRGRIVEGGDPAGTP
jgi:hypothetical protein